MKIIRPAPTLPTTKSYSRKFCLGPRWVSPEQVLQSSNHAAGGQLPGICEARVNTALKSLITRGSQTSVAFSFALLALPAIVNAQSTIQSTVTPVELWTDGNYFQKFLSSEALVAAKNSYSANQFSSCMAYYASINALSYQCGRLVMTGIRPFASVFPQLINGKYLVYLVNATWFYEGQNGPSTPISYSTDASDYYAFYRSVSCPQFHPYLPSQVANGDNSYLLTCVSYKPTPLQCSTCDPGKSAGTGAPGGVGNPIQLYGGKKTESQTDYADLRGLLNVQRQFMGQADVWRMPGDARLVDMFSGAQSPQSITEPASGMAQDGNGAYITTSITLTFPFVRTAASGEVYLTNPDGSLTRYVADGAGTFPADVSGDLVKYLTTPTADGATWRVQRANNVIEEFGADGRQRRRQLPTGAFVLFQYANGSLARTVDNWGRPVTYTPGANGVPAAVRLPDGSTISYTFQGNLLSAVTYPDGTTRQFLYNEAGYLGGYATPGSVVPYALTGTIDENGVRAGSYYYDSGGNAISTELAGGVDKFLLSYGNDSFSSVTDPLGSATYVYFTSANGRIAVSQQYRPGGPGYAASSSLITYDSAGNIASKDDFNGARACYSYDLTRNLETGRIEGLSSATNCGGVTPTNAALPAGSRKVSSQWHPDWRLETKRAEPGRFTTSVYNGQSDPFNGNAVASCAPTAALLPDGRRIAVLCKQVEQATTDVDGHLGFSAALQNGVVSRVRSWTYNGYGQVLTAKGARTDVNDTTTFLYYTNTSFSGTDPNAVGHTIGDLQRVTNALGKITNFTSYNKHGQLLSATDPNGVVNARTYDLRQRPLTSAVGGQTTTYGYDAAGQVLKVTAPDASWLGYEYDAAHRVTAVKDNLGNRIEYTLDAAGNRTVESTKDPFGILVRQLSRTIDPLGRVQQLTGRE